MSIITQHLLKYLFWLYWPYCGLDAHKLTSVSIPNNVAEIREDAFWGMDMV